MNRTFRNSFRTLSLLLLAACLALPFAACKKQEAPVATAKAPLTKPATDDHQAWVDYISDVVTRNVGDVQNQPYVYMLPAPTAADFDDQYGRLVDKAKSDVARGIIAGNMLAYGGPASTKTADMIVEAFKAVPPGTMKGVKVLYIGDAADNARVQAAVEPAGVNYVFVEAK